MKIHNVSYFLPMTKYDNTTFLFRKGGWLSIDFTDKEVRSTLIFDLKDDIILDGASIPALFRWIFKTNYKNMDYNIPWIAHDLVYVCGAMAEAPLSFEQANDLFLALMTYYNKPTKWKRKTEYKAVSSCFGRKCYDTKNTYDENNYKALKWRWM